MEHKKAGWGQPVEGRIPDGVLHYKCEEDGVRLDAIGVPGFWAKVMYPKLGAWLSPQHVNIIFNTPELDEDGCATGDIHTEMITLEQEYLQRQRSQLSSLTLA